MSQQTQVIDTNGNAAIRQDAPVQVVLRMATSLWVSRALAVAAELGLADLVKERPQTAAELASASQCQPDSLSRLLRALSSVGVFAQDTEGRFHPTALSAALESDSPDSLRDFVNMVGSGEHYDAWGNLLHSVRTGDIAFDNRFGEDCWSYYRSHPEDERRFQKGLMKITQVFDPVFLSAYDFSQFRTVVDVAGGHGAFLKAILESTPRVEGILFDAPQVIEMARSTFENGGLSGRCRLVAGDFFKSVPHGGDAYILKWIIHDWDDERSLAILKNCRRAMGRGSKLLLFENVIGPDSPPLNAFADLNMLVMTGGKERTAEEFRVLLKEAGFGVNRVIPTGGPLSIVEAVPEVVL